MVKRCLKKSYTVRKKEVHGYTPPGRKMCEKYAGYPDIAKTGCFGGRVEKSARFQRRSRKRGEGKFTIKSICYSKISVGSRLKK